MIIGSHVSFGEEQLYGSLKEAISYNANALMFYTGAPQNTIRKPIDDNLLDKAKNIAKENNIDFNNIVCHAPYIINLANKTADKWDFSVNFLINELKRCEKLGVNKIVVHPGSSVGISKEEGLDNISDALNIILSHNINVNILLETMAGKGNECGRTIDEIAYIINKCNNHQNLKVCVDTCHINDAGYNVSDFDKYLDEFNQKIGIDKIYCVHLNDSKNELGSHKDRHENIGFGTIGFDALYKVATNKRLENIPKILETPYLTITDKIKKPPYKEEIKMLKEGNFDQDIFKKNYDI
ncbi:MAG: deoxyribonuclease IV [Bacilli bacterium]|nr:deoxyribonuclease IV [Bacilli bacterium]